MYVKIQQLPNNYLMNIRTQTGLAKFIIIFIFFGNFPSTFAI